MPSASVSLFLLLVSLAATGFAHHHDEPQKETDGNAAKLAKADGPSGIVRFRIADAANGRPMPGRLTFLSEKGAGAKLFPNTDAAANELAVRDDVVYTTTGIGAITVPVGRYSVYASCGLEWSISDQDTAVEAGKAVELNFSLKHEVDTSGWVSGDFHLHTLTHSGHGDANLKERVITFLGEGLEFAVATDHNHNTDYEPTLAELGLTGKVSTVVGNEVSTSLGHFNVFPLDPSRPIPPPQSYDANALFKLIRAEPNKYNTVPVIQLNHPRWGTIDYFGRAKLDPVSAASADRTYSGDFDTIEIFNENEGWGYYDADVETSVNTASSKHSVLRDWFNLLNRGHRYAAVGNSDSHNVRAELAAYPRNFVRNAARTPGDISPADIAVSLRKMQVFTTIGPFIEFSANGGSLGDLVAAKNGVADLHIRVQAASWIDCDRVKIVVNGDVVETVPVPDKRDITRLEIIKPLKLTRDSWVALQVEGDDSLEPIVHAQDRKIRPLAVVNPIFFDVDGDGKFDCAADFAKRWVAGKMAGAVSIDDLQALPPSERGLALLEMASQRHKSTIPSIQTALTAPDRIVQLSAVKASEIVADPKLASTLRAAFDRVSADPYQRILLIGALRACQDSSVMELVWQLIDTCAKDKLEKYAEDLEPYVPGDFVSEWDVVGYFPNDSKDALQKSIYGPETDDRAVEFDGKAGVKVRWQSKSALKNGFLDLRQLTDTPKSHEKAISYARTFLFSPDQRNVRITLGTDDGCRVWLNETLVHEDNHSHGATPLQAMIKVDLKKGWNRVLMKVANGGSDHGLYFRVLDGEVGSSRAPR